MQQYTTDEQSVEMFLTALASGLEHGQGSDPELVIILAKNILQVAPSQNAVRHALEAIKNLANRRATTSNPEVANG